MGYVIRMITPHRWIQERKDVKSATDIDADSISDLHSDNNEISTWFVGNNSEEEFKKAILALASGFKRLDELKVVFLDIDNLEKTGLSLKCSDGDTKIENYKGLHRDIENLNIGTLSRLAEIILNQVWDEKTRTVNTNDIALWMLQLMDEEKLKFNDLNKDFKKGLASRIKKLKNQGSICFEELNPKLQEEINEQWAMNRRRTNCKYEGQCSRYVKT